MTAPFLRCWANSDEDLTACPIVTTITIEALSPTNLIERSVGRVRSVLWIVIPILAAVFAALLWVLTGRTLQPVTKMTARARQISAETLNEHLDEPNSNDEISDLAHTLNEMLARLD